MVSVVAVIASMDLDVINRVIAVVVERGGGGAPTAIRIAQNEVNHICYITAGIDLNLLNFSLPSLPPSLSPSSVWFSDTASSCKEGKRRGVY